MATKSEEYSKVFASEKALWENDRQRLGAEKLRLIKELEELRKAQNNNSQKETKLSGQKQELADDIMRAIEEDLSKSKSSQHKIAGESGWKVSEKMGPPPNRPSTRQVQTDPLRSFSIFLRKSLSKVELRRTIHLYQNHLLSSIKHLSLTFGPSHPRKIMNDPHKAV